VPHRRRMRSLLWGSDCSIIRLMKNYIDRMTEWSAHFIDASLLAWLVIILGALIGVMVIWFVIKRLLRWLGTEQGTFFGRSIRSVKFQNQEIIQAEEIAKIASVRDGNHITIPEEHLPSDYKPGGFNLTSFLTPKG